MRCAVFLLVVLACGSPEARPAAGSPESAAAAPESAVAPSDSAVAVLDSIAAAEAADDTAPRTKGPVPPDDQRAVEFLDQVKRRLAGTASYLSERPVTFYDINDGKTRHVGRDALEQQLRNLAGPEFDAFVHLGKIYSLPHPDSELSYRLLPNGIIVYVSDWYRLTFERENGRLQLVRLDYLQQEGE